MKILCVCTSGKDRSPIMAEYLRGRGHDSYAVGINEYFTRKNRTRLISARDILKADKIIVVSDVHFTFIRGMVRAMAIVAPSILIIPLNDKKYKNMPRDEFVSLVRAAIDKKIKKIEG